VCYTYKTKFDSAASQIKEFQSQGVTQASSVENESEISSLQAQVATLKEENAKLKSSTSQAATTAASEGVTQALQVVGSDDTTQATTQSASSTASGKTYTVKEGDTGSKICAEVYGSYTEEGWEKILSANGMTTSTVYHPGQVLKIPD
jgi:nucleoid-associated protein YgaU